MLLGWVQYNQQVARGALPRLHRKFANNYGKGGNLEKGKMGKRGKSGTEEFSTMSLLECPPNKHAVSQDIVHSYNWCMHVQDHIRMSTIIEQLVISL